jgi:prepilin-type N-terminal cleavage/methylation domain-containing protein
MKISAAMSKVEGRGLRVEGRENGAPVFSCSRRPAFDARHAFTMVEIAISLAIIGIALVGILAVLPSGLNVQRDNREGTVINQDATVFMEAIRNGVRGDNDLTNYVYAITNIWTQYNPDQSVKSGPNRNGYDNFGSSVTPSFPLNTGVRIIGLLSTPKYTDNNGIPVSNLANGGYSNHVVAYVHSVSGPAVEKPPQDNGLVVNDSFGYRIVCDNVPVQTDTNLPTLYSTNLAANLHELRLTFLWPQRVNGSLGGGHQTYRSLVAGQILQTNDANSTLYFFQSQSFTNAP